jgi:hypothetical protein
MALAKPAAAGPLMNASPVIEDPAPGEASPPTAAAVADEEARARDGGETSRAPDAMLAAPAAAPKPSPPANKPDNEPGAGATAAAVREGDNAAAGDVRPERGDGAAAAGMGEEIFESMCCSRVAAVGWDAAAVFVAELAAVVAAAATLRTGGKGGGGWCSSSSSSSSDKDDDEPSSPDEGAA